MQVHRGRTLRTRKGTRASIELAAPHGNRKKGHAMRRVARTYSGHGELAHAKDARVVAHDSQRATQVVVRRTLPVPALRDHVVDELAAINVQYGCPAGGNVLFEQLLDAPEPALELDGDARAHVHICVKYRVAATEEEERKNRNGRWCYKGETRQEQAANSGRGDAAARTLADAVRQGARCREQVALPLDQREHRL